MANPEYHGSSGDDTIDQPALGIAANANVFGGAGNDTIRIARGTALGEQGDDRIELIPGAGNYAQAAYWNSPAGVVADLAAGTAEDGWGGHDVLVNVGSLAGSSRDDRLYGDDNDNWLNPSGGHDILDGRGGFDRTYLDRTLSYYTIVPSADGMRAVVTASAEPKLRYEYANVEQFFFAGDGVYVDLADLVTPAIKAAALVADPSERWNAPQAAGTPVTVTYSFMTAVPAYGNGGGGTGFVAFDAAQQGTVRSILQWVATATGLSFDEVADTPGQHGQMRFGIDQQAATTGYTFLPNQPNAGELAGDVWMDVETVANLAVGGVGYAKLLHEIGHALGLRHPGNSSPGDAWTDVLAPADDGTWLTAMSEHDSPQGLQRDAFGALDLAALRSMYGTRALRTGDDLWTFDDTVGRVEHLLVDDGGNDILDLSSLTAGAYLELRPARPGSLGRTADGSAAQGNFSIAPGTAIETVKGTYFDDVIVGDDSNNVVFGNGGNDRIDGGAGIDTAAFAGIRSQYHVSVGPGRLAVAAASGADGYETLSSVEQLQFADATLPLVYQRTVLAPGPGRDAGFLFDPVYYLLANTSAVPGASFDAARAHYQGAGAAQGRAPTSWFDATYYETRWSDLTPLHLDDATLFQHFNLFGVWEGRSPGPLFDHFDGARYLRDYPDVAAYVNGHLPDFLGSQTNGAIAHFILFGAAEQRLAYDLVGTQIDVGYTL